MLHSQNRVNTDSCCFPEVQELFKTTLFAQFSAFRADTETFELTTFKNAILFTSFFARCSKNHDIHSVFLHTALPTIAIYIVFLPCIARNGAASSRSMARYARSRVRMFLRTEMLQSAGGQQLVRWAILS